MRVAGGVLDAKLCVIFEHTKAIQLVMKLEGLPLKIGVRVASAFYTDIVLLIECVHDQRGRNVCNLRYLIDNILPFRERFRCNHWSSLHDVQFAQIWRLRLPSPPVCV